MCYSMSRLTAVLQLLNQTLWNYRQFLQLNRLSLSLLHLNRMQLKHCRLNFDVSWHVCHQWYIKSKTMTAYSAVYQHCRHLWMTKRNMRMFVHDFWSRSGADINLFPLARLCFDVWGLAKSTFGLNEFIVKVTSVSDVAMYSACTVLYLWTL